MAKHYRSFASLIIPAIVLVSCDTKPAEPYTDPPEVIASRTAEYEKEKRELGAVTYPDCAEVWSGEKLTACGIKSLEKALETCGHREGNGMQIDALSAGDSWIDRAGRDSVLTITERAERITKSDTNVERLAYLAGGGTDEIKVVLCYLDGGMKLTSTGYTLK